MTTGPVEAKSEISTVTNRAAAGELAAFMEDWDRIMLESGAGDWQDSHELPDAERELIIAALKSYARGYS